MKSTSIVWNLRSNNLNISEGKGMFGRTSVEQNFNLSGIWSVVNIISEHPDEQHNVTTKNSNGVSVRNLSLFLKCFKLKGKEMIITYKIIKFVA
jgi:hypothetical protein